MKFYYLLLISSLVSCLQAGSFRLLSPQDLWHNYQGECKDKCPNPTNPLTYENDLGKYLGCLFLKAFDIINPDFQPINEGTDREQKIKAFKDNQGLREKVVKKMLEYAGRDNCTKIANVKDMLSTIFENPVNIVSKLFGFVLNSRGLNYANNCIEKCFDDEGNYFDCLLKTAAANLYNYDYKIQILKGVRPNFRDLDKQQIESFIKGNKDSIIEHILAYNEGDILFRKWQNENLEPNEECDVINEDGLKNFLYSTYA